MSGGASRSACLGFDMAGEAFAGTAEFVSFELNTPFSAEFFELVRNASKRNADLGLKSAVESMLVAGAVKLCEQFLDFPGQFFRSTEVDPVLASLIAVRQLVVGAESFALIGSPGGSDRSLFGEDFEVGLDEVLDLGEAGGMFLVLANGIAFFHVWDVWCGGILGKNWPGAEVG
jgi:ABC-type glucose/galactose transport system permease subunit